MVKGDAPALNETLKHLEPDALKLCRMCPFRIAILDLSGGLAHCLGVRDLRESHLFQAVLPADSASKARFALEGGVERIEEVDQGEVWQAALVLNVTLLDTDGCFSRKITGPRSR